MASIFRSAAVTASRPTIFRHTAVLTKPSSLRLRTSQFSRPVSSAILSLESLKPLHTAVASSRLISNIAVDSSCWSWLSQGCGVLYAWTMHYNTKLKPCSLYVLLLRNECKNSREEDNAEAISLLTKACRKILRHHPQID